MYKNHHLGDEAPRICAPLAFVTSTGHAAGVGETRMVYRIMVMKSQGKQQLENQGGDGKIDHKELDYEDGISCIIALL